MPARPTSTAARERGASTLIERAMVELRRRFRRPSRAPKRRGAAA